ncbi:MAG TPA: uroporphyrinogen-III synthase [Xanthobacteraceae bacterium]|jgi:uroporphyrinogen-III synthase|nr:uroporphyrinogen-III synthase [Xanthobacteraceae bacterium]
MRLLVTRPLPEALRTKAALEARGHDVTLAPLLHIEPLTPALPDTHPDAIVVTSATAAVMLKTHPAAMRLLSCPVLVVGDRTAAAVREAGFTDVRGTASDGAALVRLLRKNFAEGTRLLHLAGHDRAVDIATELAPADIHVDVVTLYRAAAAESFPGPVTAALADGTIDGVLHYSLRTAEAYLACCRNSGVPVGAETHYCLSPRIARVLQDRGAVARTAAQPNEAALFVLLDGAV